MLQRDDYTEGRLRRLRIGLPGAPGYRRHGEQIHNRVQGRSFKKYRAMWHLHLASDVQIMNRVRLRQIPTIFRQRRERGYCKQEQRKQCALHKRREALAQVEGIVNCLLLTLGAVPRLLSHY